MSSQQIFRDFLILFKNWPVDTLKTGRCLGELIRRQFSQDFKNGELTENVYTVRWSKILADLKPIANNEFLKKYPRTKEVGAMGISIDACRVVVSNDGIKEANNNTPDD
jgi:nucleoid factor 1